MFESASYLPIAAALIGVVSLFTPTDPGNDSAQRRYRGLCIIALLILQIGVCILTIQSDRTKDAKSEAEITDLRTQLAGLQTTTTSGFEEITAMMRAWGVPAGKVQALSQGTVTAESTRTIAQAVSA